MSKSEEHTSAEVLFDQIKSGDEVFLRKLYEQYRGVFVGWMVRNHRCQAEEARELYQKAFSVLYFNIKDEKITELNSSVETYLFGIGKNLFRRNLRDSARMSSSLDEVQEAADETLNYYERREDNEQKAIVKQWLDQLEEPCKSILLMAYFQRFSMEAIANRMGYKNEVVARKKKFLCLKKLREQVSGARK